jgi:hypothetical protein
MRNWRLKLLKQFKFLKRVIGRSEQSKLLSVGG